MPVKLIHEAADVAAETFDLLTQTGELTLEAETVSDFLTQADFSAVFDHPAVKECISTIEAGKIAFGAKADQAAHRAALSELAESEEETIQVISVEDALKVIDENDLEQMFLHYVETLPENTLEDRARRAAIANFYGLDEYAKGSFRKIHKKSGGPALVNRMLGAMMQKGQIQRTGKGAGYMGGDYERTAAYKAPVKKAKKAAIAKFKKANVAKLKKQAMKTRAAKKKKTVAASMGMESMVEAFDVTDLPVFGFGVPVDGAAFEVATVGNARVGESTEGASPARAAVLSEGARLVAGMNRVSQRVNG